MKSFLTYFILVSSNGTAIVIDFQTNIENCSPDIGYETDFDDWNTRKEEYMEDDDIWFDRKKSFKEPGIYKVEGYEDSHDTPDGFYYNYMVENITKISELPYKI